MKNIIDLKKGDKVLVSKSGLDFNEHDVKSIIRSRYAVILKIKGVGKTIMIGRHFSLSNSVFTDPIKEITIMTIEENSGNVQ